MLVNDQPQAFMQHPVTVSVNSLLTRLDEQHHCDVEAARMPHRGMSGGPVVVA